MTTRQGPSGPLVERFDQYSTTDGFDDEQTAQKEYAPPVAGGDEVEFQPASQNGTIKNSIRVPTRSAVQELVVRQIVLGAAAQDLDIVYSVQVIRVDDLLTLVPTGIELTIKANDQDEAKSRLSLPFAVAEGDLVLVQADHPAFAADGAPVVSKFTTTLVQTQPG